MASGCLQVPSLPGIQLDIWVETANQTRFCAKRTRGWSFYSNYGDYYQKSCGTGKTFCNGTIGLCVPSEYGCPFNGIAYGQAVISDVLDTKFFTTSEENNVTTKYLALNKRMALFPLSEFRITEG